MFEVEETQIWGANFISLQLKMDNVRFFVVGCYIPPSDLETLTDVKQAWQACPAGARPLLVGDLNFNFFCPAHGTRRDNRQTGGRHEPCRYVQALLPTHGEMTPRAVDVADEEGGEMDLLSV